MDASMLMRSPAKVTNEVTKPYGYFLTGELTLVIK